MPSGRASQNGEQALPAVVLGIDGSNLDLAHSGLILLFEGAIQGDVLIDRQRFPLGVAGDELQLGRLVGQ
jgi:hypothetical protein